MTKRPPGPTCVLCDKPLEETSGGNKFVAQVVVTTSSWLPLEELQETLDRHVGIINQIEDDLLVLDVEIDWDTLKERGDG